MFNYTYMKNITLATKFRIRFKIPVLIFQTYHGITHCKLIKMHHAVKSLTT